MTTQPTLTRAADWTCSEHEVQLVERLNRDTGEMEQICIHCDGIPENKHETKSITQQIKQGDSVPMAMDKQEAETGTELVESKLNNPRPPKGSNDAAFRNVEIQNIVTIIKANGFTTDLKKSELTKELAYTLAQDIYHLKAQGVANGGIDIIKKKVYVNAEGLMSLARARDPEFYTIDISAVPREERKDYGIPDDAVGLRARYMIKADMGVRKTKKHYADGSWDEIEEPIRQIEAKATAYGWAGGSKEHNSNVGGKFPLQMATARAKRAVIRLVLSTFPITDQRLFIDLVERGHPSEITAEEAPRAALEGAADESRQIDAAQPLEPNTPRTEQPEVEHEVETTAETVETGEQAGTNPAAPEEQNEYDLN